MVRSPVILIGWSDVVLKRFKYWIIKAPASLQRIALVFFLSTVLDLYMPTEQTPLLAPEPGTGVKSECFSIYDKFSPSQKRIVVTLVSWAGLIPRQSLHLSFHLKTHCNLSSFRVWILCSINPADSR
jgi:hypothetical protein